MPPAPPSLSPLACTAAAYARACAHAGVPGGAPGALDRYARFYREGHTCGVAPGARVVLPDVSRVRRSESDEGVVVKFSLSVPRSAAPDEAGADRPLASSGVPLTLASPEPTLETESVLIPMIGRNRRRAYTLCVSSQVGCAMGCAFCQTAQMGLIRSLTPAEIVAQWFAARWLIERPDADAPIRNIVFMGMGEPMDNLERVIESISILTDSRGPAIAMGRVTVSTVGRIDGIERLAEQVRQPGWHRLGLAVSLNAPDDEIRSRIMPVNRAAPLARLRESLLAWPFYGSAHLCLEYVLIPGVNDAPEHAELLADYVRGQGVWSPGPALRGIINVIPYNPRDHSPWPAPREPDVEAFIARLRARGIYVKRRRTKGRDAMAACGQLGNPALRRAARATLAAPT
ncbi:MAG: 23S rRNA (adenine(2503)-C(2))-methyltransferase RlmN [Phycisphaerales bacterium]